MIRKFGLALNENEVKVLVASADRDSSGDLQLDEFMELIFNDTDVFNVNMQSLKILKDQ
jgi:Ca2+-binding EF-hand superfamily protein